ncbi:MAG TPA: hypothetical protein DDW42_04255, partial [Desulfobacteraceae bacterium]|nr:hypothetical protein [Desulfobacteraceae bacterium]
MLSRPFIVRRRVCIIIFFNGLWPGKGGFEMKSVFKFTMVVFGVLAVAGLLVPSATFAAKEIKIGVIYPLTGGAAAAGRE